MRNDYNIFVEGIADEQFMSQYLHFLTGATVQGQILKAGGYTVLKDNKDGVALRNQMSAMTANGGVNLVIFDADADYAARKQELLNLKQLFSIDFELFLFPNDNDGGALEDLLERIIRPQNQPIIDCWKDYENKLISLNIPGRTPPPLTTPAKKTEIYGYLEALLGSSKKEKEQIKERNRDYQNTLHWDLNAAALSPLKSFLKNNLQF